MPRHRQHADHTRDRSVRERARRRGDGLSRLSTVTKAAVIAAGAGVGATTYAVAHAIPGRSPVHTAQTAGVSSRSSGGQGAQGTGSSGVTGNSGVPGDTGNTGNTGGLQPPTYPPQASQGPPQVVSSPTSW